MAREESSFDFKHLKSPLNKGQ